MAIEEQYAVCIWWSSKDRYYVAQCREMPGIMAHGDTRWRALISLQDALSDAVIWMRADGESLPTPRPIEEILLRNERR